VVVLVGAASGLAFALSRRGASHPPAGHYAETTQSLATEAAVRKQAVTWILHQVSRAALLTCDAQVCADLESRGFPSANLLPLGPLSNDPLGSALVVATADVRAQFGSRLASVYAPTIIASFGSGNARIDIRLVYSGTESYRAAAGAALQARKAAERQLLTNSNIMLSATARAQLVAGDVDPRLPMMIVLMAAEHPVRIVDFQSQSPGAGPASLLRWAEFATTVPAAHLTPSAYTDWIRSVLVVQRAQYHPAWEQQVRLPNGQTVLQIGYGAPSPLQ